MSFSRCHDEGWVLLQDEMTELAQRQDGLDGMLATIMRLRQIVVSISHSDSERQVLLSELWSMQGHLQANVNGFVADRFSRMN